MTAWVASFLSSPPHHAKRSVTLPAASEEALSVEAASESAASVWPVVSAEAPVELLPQPASMPAASIAERITEMVLFFMFIPSCFCHKWLFVFLMRLLWQKPPFSCREASFHLVTFIFVFLPEVTLFWILSHIFAFYLLESRTSRWFPVLLCCRSSVPLRLRSTASAGCSRWQGRCCAR